MLINSTTQKVSQRSRSDGTHQVLRGPGDVAGRQRRIRQDLLEHANGLGQGRRLVLVDRGGLLLGLLGLGVSLALLVYAYANGIFSSRRIERAVAMSLTWVGSPSSSTVGTLFGITRSTIAHVPRCEKMFTRKRPSPSAM